MSHYIIPNWPAPSNVRAYSTTRTNGHSQAPYDSFNLADHVGDDDDRVFANRSLLKKELMLSNEPLWLNQVHGIQVIKAEEVLNRSTADAIYTHSPNKVCYINTADCLPLLICDRAGTTAASIHA